MKRTESQREKSTPLMVPAPSPSDRDPTEILREELRSILAEHKDCASHEFCLAEDELVDLVHRHGGK